MHLITNKNDILIFDESQNLIHFIKHYCGSNIHVFFCENIDDLLNIDFKTISILYFCIKSISQCDLVLKLQKHVENIYIVTDLDIKDFFLEFNNVSFISNELYPHNVVYEIYQKSIELDSF